MSNTVQWRVAVDPITDALVQSHLAKVQPATSLEEFVDRAIKRELDRATMQEHERAKARPVASDGMWEIIIPLPSKT